MSLLRRTFSKIFFFAFCFVKAIFHITMGVLMSLVMIIMGLGGLYIWEFYSPEQVPEVGYIGVDSPEKNMAYRNTTKEFKDKTDQVKCWEAVQPALQILRKVCPEAAAWVKAEHDNGLMTFETTSKGYIAMYNAANGQLFINDYLFGMRDGEKAAVFAHEFRHSRQSVPKSLRGALCFVITGKGKDEIVEPDARWFEREVYIAIFD